MVLQRGGRKSRLSSDKDALKETQQLSREHSIFAGMNENQRETYQDSMTMSVCFARFALQVSYADGVLTQSELGSIMIFFAGADPSFVRQVQEVLDQDINHPETIDWDYNLREAQRILQKKQWSEFSSVIFDGLLRISLSDGVLERKELEVIYGIMANLGWSRQRTESWFRTRTGFGATFGATGESSGSYNQRENSRPAAGQKLQEAFDVMGLQHTATPEQIKKRYRELVRENHPDRYAQMGPEMQKTATQRFQVIQQAYEYIIKA